MGMLKRILSFMLIVLLITNAVTVYSFTGNTDLDKHWAKNQIARWQDFGIIAGYGDSSYKPDNYITKAEFVKILNNIFGYFEKSNQQFADVSQSDWFYDDVLIGENAGLIQANEYNQVKPNDYITREDALVTLQKVFGIVGQPEKDLLDQFTDFNDVSDSAKDPLNALVYEGILNGYTDGSIKPHQHLTRAEMVKLLDNIVEKMYTKEGIYKDNIFSRSVIVNSSDVVLENIIIGGNLYLTEGIKEGEVTLNNVTVQGDIIVTGGGENSIYFNNTTARSCRVNKENGKVRLVASGTTEINDVEIKSGVILEEKEIKKGNTGFLNVSISGDIPIEGEVSFLGNFKSIHIENTAKVTLKNCHVDEVSIVEALEKETNSQAETVLNILSSTIKKLIANAHGCKISLSSAAKINNAKIISKTTIELKKGCTINSMDISETGEGTEITGKGKINKIDNDADKVMANGKKVKKGKVISFNTSRNSSGNSGNNSSNTVPTLIADTTDNTVGQTIEIIFSSTNHNWRNNITEIKLDGRSIPLSWYTITSNSIVFDSKAFASKEEKQLAYSVENNNETVVTSLLEYEYMEYDIEVKSAGFHTANVSQRIITTNRSVEVSGAQLYYFKSYHYGIVGIDEMEELVLDSEKQYYAMFQVVGGKNSFVDATAVENCPYFWKSEDTSIATVDQLGLVKAQSVGQTAITVDFGGYIKTINLKVGKQAPSLSKDDTSNIRGEDIEITFSPVDSGWVNDITNVYVEGQAVSHTIDGNTLLISSEYFEFTPNCHEYRYTDSNTLESVYEHVYGVYEVSIEAAHYVTATAWQDLYFRTDEVNISDIKIVHYKDDSDLTIGKDYDDTLQLYAKLILENGRTPIPGKWSSLDYDMCEEVIDHHNIDLGIQWSSASTDTATVNRTGLVEAVSSGVVEITASYAGLSDSMHIQVNNIAPNLIADTEITQDSNTFRIGFTDTEWRDAIKAVTILDEQANEQPVSGDVYNIEDTAIVFDVDKVLNNYESSGQAVVYLTMDNALVKARDNIYTILVKAENYTDADVKQPIFMGLEEMVSLHEDTTDPVLGQPIEIAYQDNVSSVEWNDTVVSVVINGVTIPQSLYSIQEGKIVIDAQVFTTVGEYIIQIYAADSHGIFDLDDYYLQVTQVIQAAGVSPDFVFAEGTDLIALYEEELNGDPGMLSVKALNGSAVYDAVYQSVYKDDTYAFAYFDISDALTPDHYVVNNVPIVMLSSIESDTVSEAVYASVYGTIDSSNVEITIDSTATVVNAGQGIPEDAKPLKVNDVLSIIYKDTVILQRRWTGTKWVRYE